MSVFTINSEALSFLKVTGGYDANKFDGACNIASKNDFLGYIPEGTTLSDTPKIYEDPSGTIKAPSGWYSNEIISRYWDNDSGTFTSDMTCP